MSPQLKQLWRIVPLRPVDESVADGRSLERYRRALLSALSGGIAKAISIGSTLITIPLVLGYLGNERFGVWMTILSFVSLFNFSDFGVGNGLMNGIASASGRQDRAAMRHLVATACLVLGGIAAFTLMGLIVASSLLGWGSLFHLQSPEVVGEAYSAMLIFVCCFAIGIPAGIGQRVQMGLQRGALASAWQAVGALASLVALVAAVELQASLPVLVFASVGVPAAVQAINTWTFLVWREPSLKPRVDCVSPRAAAALLSSGFVFFALQAGGAIAYASDNFILARTLGATAVAQYSIPAKLFGIVSVASSTFLMPLWPAYGEAAARGDQRWIRATLRRSITLILVGTSCIALSLLFMRGPLLRLWIGPAVSPDFALVAGFAIWTVAEAAGSAVAIFLNGVNVIRSQLILVSIYAPACVAAKVWALKVWGMDAMPWAAAVCMFTLLVVYAVLIPRLLRHWGDTR